MPESAIAEALCAQAASSAERVAGIGVDRTLTYAELERTTGTAAAHIAAQARGETVGVLFTNTPDFIETFLGALWAGKTVAVLPSLAPPPLLKLMVAEAKLQTVLTSPQLVGRLAEVDVAPVSVEDFSSGTAREIPLGNRVQEAAVLLYTSGTTGRPKAVALNEQNMLSNAEGCRQACAFGGDEVMLADRLRNGLQQIPRVKINSPTHPGLCGAVAVYSIEGVSAQKLADELWVRRRIRVRAISDPLGVRQSCHIYNHEAQIDTTLEVIRDLARKA